MAADEAMLESLAKVELSRLQRQYRIMEGEREACSQEMAFMLRKQRNMITSLEKDKNDLMVNLTVVRSRVNEKKDTNVEQSIAVKLAVSDKLDADIKQEISESSELEKQILKLEVQLSKLRRKDVSDIQHRLIAVDKQRIVSNLENRLHVVTVHFNEVIAENGKLRIEIAHLLKERAHFNSLHQRLISRLNAGKKFMIDLIEQATLAYDQREEAQSKLQLLKERGLHDLLTHSQEMRELQRKLDHDSKLQEFLSIKGQKRILTDLEAREALKRQQQQEQTERLIEKYQDILNQICKFSGEDDIDRLAARFVKQEEENFAFFNYVNELNNEVELLQDQVEVLRGKIDDQRALQKTRVQQQQDKLGMLTNTLNTVRDGATLAQKEMQASISLLNEILKGIEDLFQLIRCDNSPLLELLGDNAHVTKYNVMLFLRIIERRTNDLLNTAYYMDAAVSGDQELILTPYDPHRLRPVPVNVMTPTQPCVLCMEQDELEDIEGMMERTKVIPVTRDEARAVVDEQVTQPGFSEFFHNVSNCRLPKARRILQNRYE